MQSLTCRCIAGAFMLCSLSALARGGISVTSADRTASILVVGDTTQSTLNSPIFLSRTQTVQDSLAVPPNMVSNGYSAQASAQMNSTLSIAPSGQSAEFSVSGTTSFAITGQTETSSLITCQIVFTLDQPTAVSLTETSSLGSSTGSGGDMQFFGAQLYNGQPQPPFNPSTNILPNIGQVFAEGGSYAGVLSPGTYTYFVQAGGNDDVDSPSPLNITTDLMLSPVPEPTAAVPLAVTVLGMIRRRNRVMDKNAM